MGESTKKSNNIILKYPAVGVCFSVLLSQILSVIIGYIFHGIFRLDSFIIATVVSMTVSVITIKIVKQLQLKIDFEIEKNKKLEIQLVENSRLAAIGRIAGGLAHEINTPLAVLRLQMNLLMKLSKTGKITPESIEKSADRIYETLDRISNFTTELRIVSKDSRNSDRVTVDIDSIIDGTIKTCIERINELGIAFSFDSGSERINVNCNPAEISQAIIKLLNNSMESIAGLAKKNITIRLERKDAFVFIRISDSGKIPEEIKDKIMEPFFTTKPIGSGKGLGLSITKSIIENHGGGLTFQSSENITVFSICLPIDSCEKVKAS